MLRRWVVARRPAGRLYGRRRVLTCGLALFAAGAVLAALAPSPGDPDGPARTRALAMLAGMATLGVLGGMLLGGVITSELGRRWVFGLTAPVVLATALVLSGD